MTQTVRSERALKLENMTRVEGEGGLLVRLEDGKVKEAKLNIFEPPRFFEAFLRGRGIQEVPDITARICGICPVAYQMSAVHALEASQGVQIDPAVRSLRRLLYCGEWIESHALHIHLLQAPDFLGYESGIAMAQNHRMEVERGLRIKKIGNDILELLGGRAIHPVSVCVGGFYKVPARSELLALKSKLEWALEASLEVVPWVAGLRFPDFHADYEFVSLAHPTEYPMNEGDVISSRGLRLKPAEYERVFLEEHVAHSTALHSVRADGGTSYFVGPVARLNLNLHLLHPHSRKAAANCGVHWPCSNPYAGIAARAIEMAYACEEAVSILNSYHAPEKSRVEFQPHKGDGCAATEAPRGLLFHHYRVDEQGLIESARIVPPTSQNLRRIEEDLRQMLPPLLQHTDEQIIQACENLVRSYDPCISCSTHFLKLKIERG